MPENEKSTSQHPFACGPKEVEKLSKDIMQLGSEIQEFLAKVASGKGPLAKAVPTPNFVNIGNAFMAAYQEMLKNPQKVNAASEQYMKDAYQLWQSSFQKTSGATPAAPVISPTPGDRRFKDPLWDQNPGSSFVMQSYLLYARWVEAVADDLEGLDDASRRKIKFYSRQFVDAVAPGNFAWTNPSVLQKTLESHGDNLLKGMTKFLDDLKNGTSLVNIQNTDRGAFKIGKDLAVTPGKVVFQNELIQLIQYEPTTNKVHKTPLLVVPAWINKFYILDLQPKNSFVKWLVDQGHTVFIISWVNPGPNHKEIIFDDYLRLGSLEAIRVIQDITGEEHVNLIGFCLGGISLSVLLGYLQKDAKKMIKSLTLMAAPLDFTQAGELTIFTDQDYMSTVAGRMAETGLLDGAAMGATFNMLRANDLIWSAFINNYLLGLEQTQFDMLYWNADTTNLPAKMFNFYIQEMCLKNALMKPDVIHILGRGVDISKAEIPIFLFAAHDDHIAPWKSMYLAIPKLHGPVKFVLGESGHVAGVVNHPDKNKYGHWENDQYGDDPNEWLGAAHYSNDSWWLSWSRWSKAFVGESIQAKDRLPGKGAYKAIEDAPGAYVQVTAEGAFKE
jgi:polyhydroxyalkanoate synthase subunit PhaC